MKSTIFGLCSLALIMAVSGFGSSDDRFIKKYAMMKIYESCFGAEVVKEIRREMKAACAKCASMSDRPPQPAPQRPQPHPMYNGRIPPMAIAIGNIQHHPRPNDGQEINLQNNEIPPGPLGPINLPLVPDQGNLDQEKLQQPLMGYQQQQGFFSPQSLGFRLGNPQVYQPISPYFPQWGPQQYPMQYNVPSFYPQYNFPPYGQRMSRDMDFRNRLEVLTSRSSGKVRNVTCVMQELGYLDQNLEPNYEKIAERIDNLPVANELKSDIQEGLQFCQKFASCVPETKRENSPLSRELIKPMFFFRCYKHKKLEACVMKDVRDRFSNEEDIDTDTEIRSMSRVGKSFKTTGASSQAFVDELDDIAVSVYDFLYGSNDMDLESVL